MTDFRELLRQRCPLHTAMTLTLKRKALRACKTYEEYLLQHRRKIYRKLQAKWILWMLEVWQE
jgi:hypothetical protein